MAKETKSKASPSIATLFSKPVYDGATVSLQVVEAIKQVRSTAANLHIACASVVLHVVKHGDPVHMNNLFQNIEFGIRREAIAKWFMLHYPQLVFDKGSTPSKTGNAAQKRPPSFKVATDEASKAKRKAIEDSFDADPDAFIAKLMAKAPWDTDKETLFKGFDFDKLLGQFVARAENAAKGVDAKGNPLPQDALSKVHVDPAKLAALKVFMASNTMAKSKGGNTGGASAHTIN